jgi:hypothetical protein
VVRSTVGTTELDSCLRCRGALEVITRHRSERSSAADDYRNAWALPLSQHGAISLAAVGALLTFLHWLLESAGAGGTFALMPIVAFLFVGVWFGWFFQVIRSTSMGRDPFEVPDFRDFSVDVVLPAARALFALSFIWGIPLVLFLREQTHDGFPVHGLWRLVFFGYAFAYAPIAMLLASVDHAGFTLNPVAGAAFAVRLGRPYWETLVGLAPVAIAEALVLKLGDTGVLQHLPLVGAWLLQTLVLYPAFIAAYLLGRLLYLRGDRLGYGRDEDYRVPLLGDVAPRGNREASAPAASSGVKR